MPVDSRSRVEDILNVILGNLDPSALQPPQSRVEALLQRLNEMISDFDGKIPIHICTSTEYDHSTLMPTIEDPDENTFYLVPAVDSGDDMYLEWIFTEGNRWERFGSGGGAITIKQSDWNQNDSTADDFIKNKPDLTLKVDKNQGIINRGKVMAVNTNGMVVPAKVEGGNISVTETLESDEDYSVEVEGDGTISVSDVRVNGATVVSQVENQRIANIPLAGTNTTGAVKIASDYGLANDSENGLKIDPALIGTIKTGLNAAKPIVPSTQHGATFYGLAKAAGDTSQASSSNAVGNYTDAAKSAIQVMLGIAGIIGNVEGTTASQVYSVDDVFLYGGALYKATASIAVNDAIVPGTNCEQTTLIDLMKGA